MIFNSRNGHSSAGHYLMVGRLVEVKPPVRITLAQTPLAHRRAVVLPPQSDWLQPRSGLRRTGVSYIPRATTTSSGLSRQWGLLPEPEVRVAVLLCPGLVLMGDFSYPDIFEPG
jgi:hypothetical protein